MIIKRINQSGMASLMFAIFMIIILSLISIGFATIVRNDQRQTLDKTLSNQAQYAAETALNRVASKLQDMATAGSAISSKTTCDNNVYGLNALANTALDPTLTGVEVTCIKWNVTPSELTADNVSNSPVSFPLNSSVSMNTIIVGWQPSDDTNNNVYGNQTSLSLTGGNVPTLRIAIGQKTNITNTNIVYAVPTSGGATYGGLATSGGIGNASCSNSGTTAVSCNLRITLPAGWIGTQNMISISSINGDSNISVRALDSGGSPLALSSAQVQIDATAKSQDVIKRLVANVSLLRNTWRPGFAASASRELCKNYRLDGGGNNIVGPAGNFCGEPVSVDTSGSLSLDNDDNLIIDGIGGPGTPKSRANPKWNLAAQIIEVSFTPTNCSYELIYVDRDGRAPNYSPWTVKYNVSDGSGCVVGNSHRFYFNPAPGRCDSIIGTSRCGQPGTYDMRVCVYGTGGKSLCELRGSGFLPYSPYP